MSDFEWSSFQMVGIIAEARPFKILSSKRPDLFPEFKWSDFISPPSFGEQLDPTSLFKKYSIFGHYSGSNSRSISGPIFDSGQVDYLYFRQISLIVVVSNRTKIFVFSTIYKSYSNKYLTKTHFKFFKPDLSKNSTLLLKNLPNIRYSTRGRINRP